MEENNKKKDDDFRVKAAIFITGFSAISIFSGFSYAIGAAKKSDPHMFDQAIHGAKDLHTLGSTLALRALGIGSVFAITGVSSIIFCVWKISGAKDMADFKKKIETLKVPKIPKNDPPQSKTEFSGLNDLLQYLIDVDKKK